MPENPPASVWPILHYRDTAGALHLLVDVLGFRAALVVRDDRGDIVHAELRWPEGGAVVFGSAAHTESAVHGGVQPGAGASYVVTDDVDAVHERAERAGVEVVEPPHETRFGSGVATRACSLRDAEGNVWTFGTYRGAP